MKHSIKIPLSPETSRELIEKIAERYDCEVKKSTMPYWEFSSGDPENFFWLGANFQPMLTQLSKDENSTT